MEVVLKINAEIDNLLNIVGDLIGKLEDVAGLDVKSDIKLILDQYRNKISESRFTILSSQQSLLPEKFLFDQGDDDNDFKDDQLLLDSFDFAGKMESAKDFLKTEDMSEGEDNGVENDDEFDPAIEITIKKNKKKGKGLTKKTKETKKRLYKWRSSSWIDEEDSHNTFKKFRRCLQCGLVVHGKRGILEHLKKEHPSESGNYNLARTLRYKCNQCDYDSKSPSNVRDHIKGVHDKIEKGDKLVAEGKFTRESGFWKCTQCSHQTSNVSSLEKHFATHAPNSEPCHICGSVPKTKTALEVHLKYHERKLQANESKEDKQHICNICGKIYTSITGLRHHNKIAHEKVQIVRNHICNLCGKGFPCESHLIKHMKTHEEKKSCPECGVKVRNMELHMQTSHTPDHMKKFQCQDCGRGFIALNNLESHRMNMHLKLKPYNCRYGCDLSYNDISNRNAHEKRRHGKLFTTVEEEKLKARME